MGQKKIKKIIVILFCVLFFGIFIFAKGDKILFSGSTIGPIPLVVPTSNIVYSTTEPLCDSNGCQIIERYFYKTSNEILPYPDEDMSLRTDHSITMIKSQIDRISIIYPGMAQYNDPITNKWFEVDSATTTITNFNNIIQSSLWGQIAYAQQFFPGANFTISLSTTTPGAWKSVTTCKSNCGGSATFTVANPNYVMGAKQSSSAYTTYRTFYTFDTSVIGNANISSTSLKLYLDGTVDGKAGTATSTYNVYNSNHSDSGANTDYGTVGSTALSVQITQSNATTNAYNTWTFTPTGINYINKYGLTKIVLREQDHDVGGIIPGPTSNTFVTFTTMGISKIKNPYLLIAYTIPVIILKKNVILDNSIIMK